MPDIPNPLTRFTPIIRAAIYLAAIVTGALVAGFTALGELPDWLIFASAAIGTLTGGTALSHLSQD